MNCPICGGHYDPVAQCEAIQARAVAFEAAYPRIHCPSCRKRVSARYDTIDAGIGEGPTVRLSCHHCDFCWEVAREVSR